MSRRWRRLSRITNFAVCAPARCARRGAGNSGTSLRWNCTSSLIAQTRCIVRTIGDQQRALDAQREIDARRLLSRRVHVVDDVDAADEGDPAVDVAELAVQPPQPVRAELPRRDLGPVLEQRDAAVATSSRSIAAREVVLRAPAVDQHAHDDAALRGADERRRDDARRRRRRRRCRSRARPRARAPSIASTSAGKYSPPLRNSVTRLPGEEPVHRRRRDVSNVAASAAWSEIRPDGNA